MIKVGLRREWWMDVEGEDRGTRWLCQRDCCCRYRHRQTIGAKVDLDDDPDGDGQRRGETRVMSSINLRFNYHLDQGRQA